MPSTFTSNTGIELPGNGEQEGVWGETVNLNMDIVDRALNGAVTVSIAGTTSTLTTLNGALSDGQFGIIVFAGSPSGAHTVTISPNTAQKNYWIRNTTTQNVIISQGSGANVTITPGVAKAIYTNGAGAGAAVFDLTSVFVGSLTGNASTATALQTARTIGGVSFNGTANINLPGVNAVGNQNTTGNAATATALQTARTIGGVSFNGTANINLPGVNIAGNQNTTGNAATATSVPTITLTAGDGLAGGGTLAENRFFAVDTTVVRTTRNIATGTGINGGGNLSADRTLSIDIATLAEAQVGTSNVKVMTPLRVKDAINTNVIGVAQTWQDVQASRTHSTSYQNTTGKPIFVAIAADANSATRRAQVSVDNATWINVGFFVEFSGSRQSNANFIVPNLWYYRTSGAMSFVNWSELR